MLFRSAVAEGDGVVARLGDLGVVAVARAVARPRLVDLAWLQPGLAADRGQQNVAEVRVARAREVGVREADDGRVRAPIAGGAGVALLERQDVGVRRKSGAWATEVLHLWHPTASKENAAKNAEIVRAKILAKQNVR